MDHKKRRKYIVRSKFQFKFVFGFISAALVSCIVSAVLFTYFSMIELEKLQWSVHLNAGSTGEVLRQISLYIIGFSFIFASILFVIIGSRMVKKINNPVHRLIKSLEFIQNGDLSQPVALRQKDEFGDIAISIDNMKEKIKVRFLDSKTQYEKVSQAIQDIDSILTGKKKVQEKKTEEKVTKILALVSVCKRSGQEL